MDLTDPRIYITLTNPSPVSVDVNATLKSYKNNISQGTAALENINIPKNCEDYTICVNQNKDRWDDTDNMMYVKVENMSDLIKNIPDRIELTDVVTSVVSEEVTIDLGINYTIITDYKVDTPLQFGPDTRIEYTENMDGWEAKAIDVDGNVLENVKVDMDVEIKAGAIGAPTEQNVKFTLTTDDGKIAGLDGIEISVVASVDNSVSDVTLNENQTMQFTEIKLKLVGGITMDLN